MQEKRKNTSWRDFVKEIASRMPMMLYKNDGIVTPYSPDSKRIKKVLSPKVFEEYRENMQEIPYHENLLLSIKEWFNNIELSWQKIVMQNENSDFNYIVGWAKNSYLSIVVVESQNIWYSYSTFNSNDIYNSILVENSQKTYQSRCISTSSNVFYSSSIINSKDIWLSSNLIGCSNCIRCNNLTNQKYYIDNIAVDKPQYDDELRKIKENTYNTLLNYYTNNVLNISGMNVGENIQWRFNMICNDVENCFMNNHLQKARNVILCNATETIENCRDCTSIWWLQSDNIYASMGVGHNSHHVYCSVECSPNCSNIYYSYLMDSCSYCLGCIGLKNKSFCILNKQYTKEEWFEKVNEIFAQMDKDWTLWKFFPWSMNPFYFNDTVAYLIDDSFTKEEVEKEWYLRRDEEIKVDIPAWAEIIYSHKVEGQKSIDDFQWFDSDWNRQINPEILKKVIKDDKWNYYRIVPMELEFLQKHWLPLPEIHWSERIKLGFKFK